MMQWYRVFGATSQSEPDVARWTQPDFPEDELHDTVANAEARVIVRTYGDHPSSAFIQIDGVDESKCVAMWHRMNVVFRAAYIEGLWARLN